MVFPVVSMDVRVGLWRRLSAEELMLLDCGVGKDSWKSLWLQGDPTSPFWRRSVLNIHWEVWCWSWNSNTLATWCEELTLLKRPWCWERLKAGRKGDGRGWNGWMASLTQWTWVWVYSGSGDGQGGLAFCSTSVTKIWTQLSNWTTIIYLLYNSIIYIIIFTIIYSVCVCVCVCACSVVSDSWWPHGLWIARFLHPGNFPGKNTGVGCHFLLQETFLT